MAAGSSQKHRRKNAKSTNDSVILVFVLLLAAGLYANRVSRRLRRYDTIEFAYIALALFGLIVCIRVLRKLRRRRTHYLSHTALNNMSGIEFERYVASLLRHQGYKHVKLTEQYDFGIDIIAEKDGISWGIQVKRYSAPVKLAAVREAVAALKHYDCDQAMVITNSSFSSSARDLAVSNSCVLIDGQELTRWIRQAS